MQTRCPAIAQFLFQSTASERQPASIEKRAEAVRSGDPDQYRGRIRHVSEASLTLDESSLGLLPFGDVLHHGNEALRPALSIARERFPDPRPDYRAVLPCISLLCRKGL